MTHQAMYYKVVQDNYSCPNGRWYTIKTLDNNSPYPGGPGSCSIAVVVVVVVVAVLVVVPV